MILIEDDTDRIAELIVSAKNTVISAESLGQDKEDFDPLVELAEFWQSL